MIKPKSRKHEDRIKALEYVVDQLYLRVAVLEMPHLKTARKWWKFWA